jgi:hypothetical protein
MFDTTPWTPGVGVRQGKSTFTSRVEMLSKGAGAFVELPPLSCGAIQGAAALAVDESHSALGQVLLLGGQTRPNTSTSSVRLVDLATGICTPQANLLHARSYFATARLPNGGIVCAGGVDGRFRADMLERPVESAPDAAWTWRQLPAMSIERMGCNGCVLSDGRFAVLGGQRQSNSATSSCEVLTVDDDEHWSPLPSMHDSRARSACAAVAGCIIVAGGSPNHKSAEVFDEVLGRWLRLPHDLPCNSGLHDMGSALL